MNKSAPYLSHFQLNRLPRWVRLVLYLVIFIFIVSTLASGWDKIKDYQWQFKPGIAALALCIFVLYLILLGILVTWIVRRMELPLTYRTGIIMFLQSLVARYIPGGIWSFASVAVTGRELGLPSSMLVIALILKELFVVWASAWFTLPVIIFRFRDSSLRFDVLAAAGLVASLILAPFLLRLVISRIIRWRKLPLDLAIHRVTSFQGVFLTLVAFIAVQLFYLLASFLFLRSVTDLPTTTLLYGALAMNGAWLFGLLILFAPQGLGAREAAMVFLLLPFVDAPVAIALSLGFRLMTTLSDLILFIPLVMGSVKRKIISAEN